jgi:hypothetical protein
MMAGRKKKTIIVRTMRDFRENFYPKSNIHPDDISSDPKDIAQELVKKTFKVAR